MRAEFATAWAAFRETGSLVLSRLDQRLPFWSRAGTSTVKQVQLIVVYGGAVADAGATLKLQATKDVNVDFAIKARDKAGITSADTTLVDSPLQDLGVSGLPWSVANPAGDWVITAVGTAGVDATTVAKSITSLYILGAFTFTSPQLEAIK